MADLNDRLQIAMDLRGNMKPAQLASATGISKSGISFILKGTTRADTIRATTIDQLATALRVNRDWLLYGTGPMEGVAPGKGVAVSYVARLDPAIINPALEMTRAMLGKEVTFDPCGDVPLFIAAYELMADATIENRARFDAALASREAANARGNPDEQRDTAKART